MSKRVRRNFWVDGQIQGALAIRVIAHWLIFASIAAVLTFTMQFLGDPLQDFSTHWKNVWANQGLFALVIAILMPLFIYDTVRLSNRFAGPIVRIRRTMRDISEGKRAEKLSFRDNDFWSGLAADFNRLIDEGYLQTDGKRVAASSSTPAEESHEPNANSV